MKFFQKRSVAWVITICMILTAIFIGQYKQQQQAYLPSRETESEEWAWENYTAYDRYIDDHVGLLSEHYKKQLSVYNAVSDYMYDTVCGILVLDDTENAKLETVAEQAFGDLQLSSRDLVLILDTEQENWHLSCGSSFSENDQHALELMVNEVGQEMFRSNGNGLLKLFSEFGQWFATHLSPINAVNHVFQFAKFVGRTARNMILFSVVIGFAVIGGIIYMIIKLCKKSTTTKNTVHENAQYVRRASERNTGSQQPRYTSQNQQKKDEDRS